ncbi:MAG: hypothetical protein ACRDU0_11440 [Mycobacterium sp.]
MAAGDVTREVDAFVRRRLLATDTGQGHVVIGVTHEAFLSAWPPLAQAIQENVSALRARRAIEQAATEWDNEGRLDRTRSCRHPVMTAADCQRRRSRGDTPTLHPGLQGSGR